MDILRESYIKLEELPGMERIARLSLPLPGWPTHESNLADIVRTHNADISTRRNDMLEKLRAAAVGDDLRRIIKSDLLAAAQQSMATVAELEKAVAELDSTRRQAIQDARARRVESIAAVKAALLAAGIEHPADEVVMSSTIVGDAGRALVKAQQALDAGDGGASEAAKALKAAAREAVRFVVVEG